MYVFSAPANCLDKHTEYNISYLGDSELEDRDNYNSADLEECRGHCKTKDANYFTYLSDPGYRSCYCMSTNTKYSTGNQPISGNTNLSLCNGECICVFNCRLCLIAIDFREQREGNYVQGTQSSPPEHTQG